MLTTSICPPLTCSLVLSLSYLLSTVHIYSHLAPAQFIPDLTCSSVPYACPHLISIHILLLFHSHLTKVKPFFFTSSVHTCSHLVFIQLTILVFLLSLILEGDDDKTHEDVNHEEGNDNDEDEIEDGHSWPIVLDWTFAFCVRVDGAI